jgi:release factor glutamine methyltransferase
MVPEVRTIGSLVAWARAALDRAGVANPIQEAGWLVEHALGLRTHQIVSEGDRPVSAEAWVRGASLVARRAAREPLQYILGTHEFCGLVFAVGPGVLIPRPETELLVQEVVRRGDSGKPVTIVDVGTGSGCLAVTLATLLKEARILAVDRSPEALALARGNARKLGVEDRVEWYEGDLLAPLQDKGIAGAVDVIVSNPPYISEGEWAGLQPEVRLFEPRMALVAGPDGTEFHERLLREALTYLVPGGLLLMEVGQGQAPVVRRIAARLGGYAPLRIVEDAAGIERVVIAQRLG